MIISALVLLGAFPAAEGTSSPVFVFGGGWGPEGTQASIESHVLEVAGALEPFRPAIAFAAGTGEGRVVQVTNDAGEPTELLALVFDRTDNLNVAYRPTTLDAGAADRSGILAGIERAARASAPGRPALVVGVGHGSPQTDEGSAAIEGWGAEQRVTVDDVHVVLEASEHRGAVGIVLGHCHSGAFARLAFEADKTVPKPPRCVFAAVPADREAAGCTPDVDDPSSRSYVHWFIRGLGDTKADLDKDGDIDWSEAHAYAVVRDETIDRPIRSSDVWLRTMMPAVRAADRTSTRALLNRAPPPERWVLSRVVRPLPKTVRAVRVELEQADLARRSIEEEAERRFNERDATRRRILDRLLRAMPELVNPYHPVARKLLATDRPSAALNADPEIEDLKRWNGLWETTQQQLLELEQSTVRLERWLDAADRIERLQRARRLPAPQRAHFRRLRTCESLRLVR